jgi:hypothetical protein
MALSNQSDLVTYWHFYPWKDNFKVGLMPEDDLPRMAKSWKMKPAA